MENGELEIVKSYQKQEIDFKPLHIMKTMRAGNRLLSRKFVANVAGPKVPKHLVLTCLVTHRLSEMLNFPRKSKSSGIVCGKSSNNPCPMRKECFRYLGTINLL